MKKILEYFFITVVLSGCVTKTVEMYPVSGPAAQLTPLQIIRAKAVGGGSGGSLTAVLPNGSTCTGRWASTVSTRNNGTFLFTNDRSFGLKPSGVIPGRNPGEAFLSCTDNTVLTIQFMTGSAGNGFGEARDNKGNIYRVVI